jgi:putative membrane protein insertion efficiency factor
MKQIFYRLIVFYQKFISVLSPPSCRYIPTCSEYAKVHIRHTNLLKAIYLIITRILSCNQFFSGGFDYPIVDFVPKNIVHKKSKIDFWYIPVKNKPNKYYLVNVWKDLK